MREDELYKMLRAEESSQEDWAQAADQFLKLKIASGGVTQHQVEVAYRKVKVASRFQELVKEARMLDPLVHDAVRGAAREKAMSEVAPEDVDAATQKGMLAGIRSKVTGDMGRAEGVRRKRGETLAKLVGALGGGTAGGMVGNRLSPGLGGAALGTAAGAIGGHMLGKTVGSEIDRARMDRHMMPPKEGEMEKETLAAAPESWVASIAKHVKDKAKKLPEVAKKTKWTSLEDETKEAGVRGMLRKRAAAKIAQEGDGLPIQPTPGNTTMGSGLGGEGVPPEIEQFMAAQQQMNEAEFFRQQAEEAGAQAQQLQEQAETLDQQNQQLQQQVQQTQMDSQQQTQMAQQQAQSAQQESQMAQQDAMAARDESLQAQQQNLAIRNAVTQYRQQLMDLLSQDPMSAMGPPAVPTGPAPMPPGPPPGPEQGGPPPGAEGMPPGQPGEMPPEAAGGPPGAEQGMPPPGAEMAPPEAPQAPPAVPEAPAQGGSPVTVNVKAPKPAKQPAQPAA